MASGTPVAPATSEADRDPAVSRGVLWENLLQAIRDLDAQVVKGHAYADLGAFHKCEEHIQVAVQQFRKREDARREREEKSRPR